MSRPALWTKHRKIALAIARDYQIPGLDPDDVRQEALVALWEATRCYDRDKGPFPPFARLVVKRRLADQHDRAKRRIERRRITFGKELAVPIEDTIERRARIEAIARGVETLTDRERAALADHLNGVPATSSKAHNNALTAARRKLRKVA